MSRRERREASIVARNHGCRVYKGSPQEMGRLCGGIVGLLISAGSASAQGEVVSLPVPPVPPPAIIEEMSRELGNPINRPITGAAQVPGVVGGERPPSLEALQAARARDHEGSSLEAGRREVLQQAGLTYGAQGGLSARSFAIDEMLRRYESILDTVYDFGELVVRLGEGMTYMRPPIVTQAELGFALGENGQVARETACIYQITREAQLTSVAPNWRAYLVRVWGWPSRPSEAVLPRTEAETTYWTQSVAEGWAEGERQAVEIFLADLGRIQRDFVGMARYHVLLKAGLVENPRVTFQTSRVNGGGAMLRAGDRIVRIEGQGGLQANPRQWGSKTRDCPGRGAPAPISGLVTKP